MDITTADPAMLNALFARVRDRDSAARDVPAHRARWLFAERLLSRGDRAEMGFDAWEGPEHLVKFFNWHVKAAFPDPFPPARIDALVAASSEVDARVFRRLGLHDGHRMIARIARYNAQDHLVLHAVPQPERNRPRVLLDFGAGHGRLAALGFNAPDEAQRFQTLVAVDAIPSTYFTQAAYYRAMGLSVWEYFEHQDDSPTEEDVMAASLSHQVIHLPTWRMDLIPDGCIDMVSCVQVLKELPGGLVADLIATFARVTHATGAIYVRDHLQFHNPNHMPIDLLLQASGFDREFAPAWIDRVEIHGLPRIWRKVDPSHYVAGPNS